MENHSWILSNKEIEQWYQKNSGDKNKPQVNSGNLILTIGGIYEGQPDKNGLSKEETEKARLDTYSLGPGAMVLIKTDEHVKMNAEYFGVVFGTNSKMSQGLLIVNPGFITSGHNATVAFFVVNISRNSIELKTNDSIARLCVFRSVRPKPFFQEKEEKERLLSLHIFEKNFERLIGENVTKLVKKQLRLVFGVGGIAILLIATLVTLIAPMGAEFLNEKFFRENVKNELKNEILEEVEESMNRQKERIKKLEERLYSLH